MQPMLHAGPRSPPSPQSAAPGALSGRAPAPPPPPPAHALGAVALVADRGQLVVQHVGHEDGLVALAALQAPAPRGRGRGGRAAVGGREIAAARASGGAGGSGGGALMPRAAPSPLAGDMLGAGGARRARAGPRGKGLGCRTAQHAPGEEQHQLIPVVREPGGQQFTWGAPRVGQGARKRAGRHDSPGARQEGVGARALRPSHAGEIAQQRAGQRLGPVGQRWPPAVTACVRNNLGRLRSGGLGKGILERHVGGRELGRWGAVGAELSTGEQPETFLFCMGAPRLAPDAPDIHCLLTTTSSHCGS